MGTKKIFNLLLLTALAVPTIGRAVMPVIPGTVKAGLGVLASGFCMKLLKDSKENGVMFSLTSKLGVHEADLGNVVGLCGSLLSISAVANKEVGNECMKLGFLAPVAATVNYVITRKSIRSLFCSIPLIGPFLGCASYRSSNSHDVGEGRSCSGICKDCFLTNAIVFAAIYTGVDHVATRFFAKTDKNDTQGKDDDEEELQSRRRTRRRLRKVKTDYDQDKDDDESSESSHGGLKDKGSLIDSLRFGN